ncbi:MAG: acetolactate synthase small subunit [Bacteroidales bacterium]|nr:acetolactate synthase small subunit [Bacteroidales bacterium]MDD3299352.1 acetolactate synthase small subunit [Bacteroidales bacterium]MDD3843804.1 acetolactate synthase small subunit [Bacteroidales bacterium]MDD4618244.1 acetolactate synthase small subunit [Bacteroidales bacterium]
MENKEFIVLAFVNNQISVLNRITSAYLKRHINIESLNVSESYIKGISTVVISAIISEETVERIVNQLNNNIDILNVNYFLQDELIYKEMALYKISPDFIKDSLFFNHFLNRLNGKIIEISNEYIIAEKSGSKAELDALKQSLERKNLLISYARSGNVVLQREPVESLLRKVS